MELFLLIIELIISILLIITILMHAPKGEGLGGIGGQARLYNAPKGMEAGLNRVTTILTVCFLLIATILGAIH